MQNPPASAEPSEKSNPELSGSLLLAEAMMEAQGPKPTYAEFAQKSMPATTPWDAPAPTTKEG